LQSILGRLAQIHYGDGGLDRDTGRTEEEAEELWREARAAYAMVGGDTGATLVIQALREVSNRD
jgi:hypothetical protein